MTLGVNQRTFVGVLTGLRVTMPVIQSGVTFSYSFQR